MMREKLLAVLFLSFIAIVLSLPQQSKSKRPTPVFKVFRHRFLRYSISQFFDIAAHRKSSFPIKFSSNLKLVACCFPTMRRSSATTSSTRFPARIEFTDITPTWRTNVKCSTCVYRKLGARLDGVLFAPLRQFSIK